MNMAKFNYFLGICLFLITYLIGYSVGKASDDSPLQLATIFHDDIPVEEYWISEKLDGIRARWNGHSLTTKNGNNIHTPAWFVADFPAQMLEGELWLGRGQFEQTVSIVMRDTPTEDWRNIRYMLFDLPKHQGTFSERIVAMQDLVTKSNSAFLQLIPQFKVPAPSALMNKLNEWVKNGAEGLMLHHQLAYYQDGRSEHLLKLKLYQDAEAKVISHLPGKGKYLNQLGAVLVEMEDGRRFKIGSGFSDLERQNPPPLGAIITFKYYGLTNNRIPRFASYLHVRPQE